MRTAWVAALAVLGAMGLQAPPPVSRVVVVVDGDAPAADPVEAARLRDALLGRLAVSVPVSYVELTANGLTAVPEAEAASYRRTRFTVTPPTYNGIAVSFAEGVEVLRGNEFVRDSVIERECPPASEGCAGRVRAAVEAEVRRAESTAARKLRSLATEAAQWRGARVVLVTAGWPSRGDDRVAVAPAARALERSGASLVVVRVLPPSPYRGLVRDAAEGLAAHLRARWVTLDGDADLDAAADAAWADLMTASASTSTAAAAVVTREPEPRPEPKREPTPAVAPGVAAPSAPFSDEVLLKAAAYVDRFERTFTSVLWHERYEQESRVRRRFSSSGASTVAVAERRLLESELFFAWLPQDATWITVRDAIAVDGRPRPEGERRLPSLAARATVSLPELRELALQNGRFNLGGILWTFNEPTLPLLFLDARYRDGVRFTRGATRQEDGRTLVTYEFVEQRRPTIIRSGAQNVPASGTLRIDAASGAVWSTTMELVEAPGGLSGRMAVDYQPHVAFDVLVPREMRESYTSPTQQIDAQAAYSDFRRFQTAGRLILTPP